MTKDNLTDAVQSIMGGSRAEAGRVVDAVFDGIVKSLTKGEEVRLAGFGVFRVKDRKARTARNPRTGETVAVAASKVPRFSAAKALKEAVQ